MIALEVDELTAGHAAVAIAEHVRALRRLGQRPPAGLVELGEAFVRAARGSQRSTAVHSGPTLADLAGLLEGAAMRPPQLLRFPAAAAQLDCSTSTVKRLVAAGDLPAVTVAGGERRIRQADLDAFVAARPVEVAS